MITRYSYKFKKDGKDQVVEMFSPMGEKITKDMVGEIFAQDQYKVGLDHLKSVKDGVVLDIGGNIGLSAIYFKDYATQIYAVEPTSETFQALLENTREFSNIKPFKLAIMNENGPANIHINDSGLVPDSIFGNSPRRETVQGQTIEKFMTDQEIEHIDLLKIDTEGAEYAIFPSMAFERMAPKIDVIIGEAHQFGNVMPAYIPLILKDYGYKFEWLPIDNYFKFFIYKDKSGKEKRYQHQMQTIFHAWR